MKYHLTLNGKHTHDVSCADPLESEIPKNWGYVYRGWRTESELLQLGYLKEGKTAQEVVVRPSETYEVSIGVDVEGLSNFIDLAAFTAFCQESGFAQTEVDGKHYYTTPEVKETQYWIPNNFVVVVEEEEDRTEIEALIAKGVKDIEFGKSLIALFSASMDSQELSQDDVLTTLGQFVDLKNLLETGSINTVKNIITSMDFPLKDLMLSEINRYLLTR